MTHKDRKRMISFLPLLIHFHGITFYMWDSKVSKLSHSYAVKVSPDNPFYFPCRAQWFGVYILDSRSSTLKVETHRARQRTGPEEGLQAEVGASELFFAEDWPTWEEITEVMGNGDAGMRIPVSCSPGRLTHFCPCHGSHPVTHELCPMMQGKFSTRGVN